MWIIIRAAGAFCIISAGILMGMEQEHRLKRRWRIFREMHETLLFLEKEMTYHRSPLQGAFQCAAKRCTTELRSVLSETALRTEKRSGRSFGEIWKEVLEDFIPAGLFSRDEMDLFKETATALCNADTVMQKILLEKYADRFRMLSEAEAEICHEKGGLYLKLAAAAGVFLVILLV